MVFFARPRFIGGEVSAERVMAKKKTAWERRPGEPARAYDYAWQYITLGPQRSLEKLVQGTTQKLPSLGSLKNLSAKWRWVRRAAAYDRWIERQNLEQAELSALEQAKKWEQRDQERRESDYSTSLQLRAQLQMMLNYPLVDHERVVERYEDGREKVIQIFKVSPWRKSDIVRFWQAASAMGGAAIRNEGATSTDTKLHDVLKFVDYKSAGKGAKEK
jgi:hypothetical protein